MTYLEEGRCSFSNNLSENSIRPVTVGRKNWPFSDTPEGAQANTLYLTVVEMAKAYGLDLYKYLNFLFEQRPSKDMSDEELEKLAPWNLSFSTCLIIFFTFICKVSFLLQYYLHNHTK